MSKISGSSNGYQILSDGKSLAFIWQEQGEDVAIFLPEYMMSQWNVNVAQDTVALDIINGYKDIPTGLRSIEIDISLLSSGKYEYKKGKDLMLEMDLFSKMSVRDLFKIINKKLNRRP